MDFNEQSRWIDNKILQLMKARDNNSFLAEEIQADINVLRTIRDDYNKAQKRSIELSWSEHEHDNEKWD